MMPVLKGKTPPPAGGASFAKEAGEKRIQTPALFRKKGWLCGAGCFSPGSVMRITGKSLKMLTFKMVAI
jgi:hypothetical protein